MRSAVEPIRRVFHLAPTPIPRADSAGDRPSRHAPRTALGVALGIASLLFITAGSAMAGVNAGGMLVVHDVGITYTDTGGYPWPSETPTCAGVDNELPTGIPPGAAGWIWKVYAAFPQAASPRLKALCFGGGFPESVTVLAGGVPHDMDFEIPAGAWPYLPGYGVMMSFGQTQTDTVVECYWLAGYGDGGKWELIHHPTQTMMFVDDAWPPLEDQIIGLGAIGFGEPGETYCPDGLHIGACCFSSGSCLVLEESDCGAQGGLFRGVGSACDPDPCRFGACCLPSRQCFLITPEDCMQVNGLYIGDLEPCDPSPCPQSSACCEAGICFLTMTWICEQDGGIPYPDLHTCYPNPCPAGGACCFPDGTCRDLHESQCTEQGGEFHVGLRCWPDDPCGYYGACCLPDGSCRMYPEDYCPIYDGEWQGMGVPCTPNPCGQDGACCFPDGTCRLLTVEQCAAQAGGWMGAGTVCVPNPCTPTPVERTSWGKVKNKFR